MDRQKRLIIEVSSSGNGYLDDYGQLIKKDEYTNKDDNPICFYCNQKQVTSDDNKFNEKGADYNFVFIRDDDNRIIISDEINYIIQNSNKDSIAIAVHNSMGAYPFVRQAKEAQNNSKNIFLSSFSHVENNNLVWNQGLKPFVEGIGSEEYDDLFDNLWNLITDVKSQAIVLRSEILSPMVALDLIRQAKDANNGKMKHVDDILISDTKNILVKAESKINELSNIIKDDDLTQSLKSLIAKYSKEPEKDHYEQLYKTTQLLEANLSALKLTNGGVT